MNWIDVKQELPAQHKSVLLRHENGQMSVGYNVTKLKEDPDGKLTITHWMELPEQPDKIKTRYCIACTHTCGINNDKQN